MIFVFLWYCENSSFGGFGYIEGRVIVGMVSSWFPGMPLVLSWILESIMNIAGSGRFGNIL